MFRVDFVFDLHVLAIHVEHAEVSLASNTPKKHEDEFITAPQATDFLRSTPHLFPVRTKKCQEAAVQRAHALKILRLVFF